jgi:hypothetical protein
MPDPAAVQLGFSDLMMELALGMAERDHDAAVAQTCVDAMAQLGRCVGAVSDESGDQPPPPSQPT